MSEADRVIADIRNLTIRQALDALIFLSGWTPEGISVAIETMTSRYPSDGMATLGEVAEEQAMESTRRNAPDEAEYEACKCGPDGQEHLHPAGGDQAGER